MTANSHKDRIGHLLGRLLAVVEYAQGLCRVDTEESVRMRFMDAASTTPQRVLPEMLKAYNKCYVMMMKRESSEIGRLEEVMDEIGTLLKYADDGVPKVLSTQGQCDFFIGYRHQRSDLRG